jgi:hypothetical protein
MLSARRSSVKHLPLVRGRRPLIEDGTETLGLAHEPVDNGSTESLRGSAGTALAVLLPRYLATREAVTFRH